MANTYTWELKSLRKMNSGSYENIIFGTTWMVKGTDEETGIEGVFSGATPFKANEVNPNEFIPYNELNGDIVLDWVKQEVSGSNMYSQWTHIEQMIQKQIDDKKFMVSEVHENNFPWSPSGSAGPMIGS